MRWEVWVLFDATLAMFAYMGYVIYIRNVYRCPICYAWWNHKKNKYSHPTRSGSLSICRNCGRQF